MPAVDLARLARQVEHVRAVIGDPPAFRSRFRDLMGFYADRTRRSGSESARGPSVPPPVLNALANGLVEATESDADRAALLADVLWSLETREARLVALVLLRRQPPSDLVFRVLAWSETSEDPQVLAELAGVALAPVRAQQPEAFLQSLAGLRRDYKHRRRAFALRALQAAVEDRSFHSIPRILELLPPGPEEPVGEERRALNDLGVALARRTPGETSRWLREALDRRQAWAYPVALAAVEVLPERSRPSLELSLMGAGAAGIMTSRND